MIVKKLIMSTVMIFANAAWAKPPVECAPTNSGTLPLTLVNTLPNTKDPVTVQWSLDDSKNLLVHFDVDQPVLHEKKAFGVKDYPFQYDVVEIFFAVNDPKEKDYQYFELEITPNKQIFNVRFSVVGGKLSREEGVDLGAETTANKTKNDWSGSFIIPLEALGWKGDAQFIRGNFYAITGKKPNRKFWSTFLPKTSKPDFNKPEHFKPLFECK
jgi:hypothetical protein